MQKPNTKEIANALGVSRATVSNVINGKGRVSPEMRIRIEKAIAESGYIRDRGAVALRTGQSRLVGVLVTDIANPFYANVVSQIEAQLSEAGYATVLGQSKDDPARQSQILDELLGNGVAGLVVNPCVGTTLQDLSPVLQRQIPITFYVRGIEGSDQPTVSLDDRLAAELMATHMLDQGYRNFAMIGGFRGTTTFENRVFGARRMLDQAGCSVRLVPGPITEAFGYSATESLLNQGCSVDAIIGHNDIVALGCLRAIRDFGLRVGADVGLAGFDNLLFGRLCEPQLTTIDVDTDAIGAEAGRSLVAQLRGEIGVPEPKVIAPRLIVRGTTSKIM